MVLFALSEGATASLSDWHWEWTLELILFSLPPQAEPFKAGCPGPGRSLVSPRMGIIIEGRSRFTKVALKKKQTNKTPHKTKYLPLARNNMSNSSELLWIFSTENLKNFFFPLNQVETNTTSQVLLRLFNTT